MEPKTSAVVSSENQAPNGSAVLAMRDVPARRAVDARELLDHPERGHRVELEAAPATRPEQVVAPRVPQRLGHVGREPPLDLRLGGRRADHRLELSDATQHLVDGRSDCGFHAGLPPVFRWLRRICPPRISGSIMRPALG